MLWLIILFISCIGSFEQRRHYQQKNEDQGKKDPDKEKEDEGECLMASTISMI